MNMTRAVAAQACLYEETVSNENPLNYGVVSSKEREAMSVNDRDDRRLLALLSGDIVGYSRLMAADQEGNYSSAGTAPRSRWHPCRLP